MKEEMKQKLAQFKNLLKKKNKQIIKQSPEINIIKNNRNNFGYPTGLNQNKIEVNKPK